VGVNGVWTVHAEPSRLLSTEKGFIRNQGARGHRTTFLVLYQAEVTRGSTAIDRTHPTVLAEGEKRYTTLLLNSLRFTSPPPCVKVQIPSFAAAIVRAPAGCDAPDRHGQV